MPANLQDYENLPDPATKTELLERMDATYQAAESLIAAQNEAALTQPLTGSGWSIKDHLAHLMAWEKGMVALLQKWDRFEEMGIVDESIDITDHNAINKALYEKYADWPFDEIYLSFRAIHQNLIDVLGRLSDVALRKSYRHYQPWAEGDYLNNPVMGWLAGNTYAHYAEHLLEIGRHLPTAD